MALVFVEWASKCTKKYQKKNHWICSLRCKCIMNFARNAMKFHNCLHANTYLCNYICTCWTVVDFFFFRWVCLWHDKLKQSISSVLRMIYLVKFFPCIFWLNFWMKKVGAQNCFMQTCDQVITGNIHLTNIFVSKNKVEI